MITNKVGLEAEFFVTNKKGDLVFPSKYGFNTDEYIILGEFRAEPADNIPDAVANFLKEYYKIQEQAKKKGVLIDLSPFKLLTKAFHAEVLKTMGTKEISVCNNIYGTDILEDTDVVIEDGKVVGYYASIGLHIHFSSGVVNQETRVINSSEVYAPVNIPIGLFDNKELFNINLYRKLPDKSQEQKITVTSSCNLITKPVIEHIVKSFDTEVLPKYLPKDVTLKYRQPGFYEVKSDGRFEYRSLPMSINVLSDIYEITSYALSY